MFNYKRILKNRTTRDAILRFMKFIPDNIMLRIEYWVKLGRMLNLKTPQRYTEKIQWLKLFYRKPEMVRITDKYTVRSYVKECGLEDILNECYGIYDTVEQIDFQKLPQQFVVKDTLGSGSVSVLIIKDKASANIDEIKSQLNKWISDKSNELDDGREWAYHSGEKHRIIIEKFLKQSTEDLVDFKFLCFEGEPRYIVHDKDRFGGHKRTFFDLDWNRLDVKDKEYPVAEEIIPKPKNLDEMINVAKRLSRGFPALRVDLYNVNGKIIFGELTCYPWSGLVQFCPDKFDFEMGKYFVLPNEKKENDYVTLRKNHK